ncbi:MAG: hypothetical protein WBG02_06040 [Candidatus Acidiferrum sp.]
MNRKDWTAEIGGMASKPKDSVLGPLVYCAAIQAKDRENDPNEAMKVLFNVQDSSGCLRAAPTARTGKACAPLQMG